MPEILEQVLKGFDFRIEIQDKFLPRNYCVQYRESDWDFASRLMEEEGIYYYFEHTEDAHRLVLDCMETIMHDRHLIVESEQFELVNKDKHLHVRHNHNERIEGTMSLKVDVNLQEKVGSNYALDAGTNSRSNSKNCASTKIPPKANPMSAPNKPPNESAPAS